MNTVRQCNTVQPRTLAEIFDLCASNRRLLPIGGRTKNALAAPDAGADEVTLVDMRAFSGVVSYDASEFLITVRGGTAIGDLVATLAERGQYLPFDPVLAAGGATVGGSIASGISGPCRLLYGGLRDFMLEVALCDSSGREIRGGGKVVKNAAGFDLPKLVVGSYGRMGLITEATLKVFPRPQAWLTLHCETSGLAAAIEMGLRLLALPLPIAALEIEQPSTLLVRLAGPLDSLAGVAARAIAQLGSRAKVTQWAPGEEEMRSWSERAEFAWAADAHALVRVAVAHHQCLALCQALDQLGSPARRVISCGASVVWLAATSADELAAIDRILSDQKLSGVVVCGSPQFRLLGDRRWIGIAERIRAALDPAGKLPQYA
ncbi:MAG: FAD-binding protein [Aureliella sp.]